MCNVQPDLGDININLPRYQKSELAQWNKRLIDQIPFLSAL